MGGNPADNGGRRSGIDRRIYTYSGHIPERRSGEDRRIMSDRRTGPRLGPEYREVPPSGDSLADAHPSVPLQPHARHP
ncbi:MAG: hypothetical protein PVH30_07245 [Desulfobacterales bacterium]